MKKTCIFLAVCLALLSNVIANPVDKQTAQRAAQTFWQKTCNNGIVTPAASWSLQATPYSTFYVFEYKNGQGFVVIAADDHVVPIIGYSDANGWGSGELPANLDEWLRGRDEQVRYVTENHIESTPEIDRFWASLLDGSYEPPQGAQVNPLISTTWGQSPYYNNYCPEDNGNNTGHALTGCVATATGQVMKYWNYPKHGIGSHSYTHPTYGTLAADFGSATYSWSDMPNALSNLSTNVEKNAVATLLYHIGVSVEMDYGPTGSGSLTYRGSIAYASAFNSLVRYFGYKSTIRSIGKVEDSLSDAEWIAALKPELDAHRPMLYSASDANAGGHAFICDGYNASSQFHFNWGWRGSCDGYYAVSAMNPQSGNTTYQFTQRQRAVLGIEPDSTVLHVSEVSVNAASAGESTALYVMAGSSSSRWSAVCNQSWVTLSASNGSGSYAVSPLTLTFAPNTTGVTRNAILTVTQSGTTDTVYLRQESTEGSDTVGYDEDGYYSAWSYSRWGVRIPPEDLVGVSTLSDVMVYVGALGNYQLTVSTGTATAPTTQLATMSRTFTYDGGWQTCSLATPVAIDPTQSLWLTFYNPAGGFPACISTNGGAAGHNWVSSNGTTWSDFSVQQQSYATNAFMIRGIFNRESAPGDGALYDTVPFCDDETSSYTWPKNGTRYTWRSSIMNEDANGVYMGDDSVTVNDTVYHLHLVFYGLPSQNTVTEIACDSYTWGGNGQNYTSTPVTRPTVTYTGANRYGCDSTVYLNLTINRSSSATDVREVCDSIRWIDGNWYNANNNVAQDTLTNSVGCDSVVTLNLTVNHSADTNMVIAVCGSYTWYDSTYTASGVITHLDTTTAGCDSVITIRLTVNPVDSIVDPHTVCDSYRWIDGNIYTESNTSAVVTLHNQYNCDSIVRLDLTVNNSTHNATPLTRCDTYTWPTDGNTYTTSGTYVYDYQNEYDCPSADTLHLTVNYNTSHRETERECGSYTWHGRNYTSSVIDTFSYNAANGCPSVDTLDLVVRVPNSPIVLDTTVCEQFLWRGMDEPYTETGVYTYNTYGDLQCAAPDTLRLTILPATDSTEVIHACDSITWMDGMTYTASNYTAVYRNGIAPNGCDSVFHLDLTIRQTKYAEVWDTACERYVWNGNTYRNSRDIIYPARRSYEDGCDTVTTLHLTINHNRTHVTAIRPQDSLVCDNKPFEWNGKIFSHSVVDTTIFSQSQGCDSIDILDLTVLPATRNVYNQYGCDSVAGYMWTDSIYYFASGNAIASKVVGTASNGCDVMDVLNLTFYSHIDTAITLRVCDSLSWRNGDGNTAVDSVYRVSTTLTGNFHTQNPAHCDSTVHMTLTVYQSSRDTVHDTACYGYTWEIDSLSGGRYTVGRYGTTGIYSAVIPNAAGCDSVITLYLLVHQTPEIYENATVCDSLRWIDGNLYTRSTAYPYPSVHLGRVPGTTCDTVKLLRLQVNYSSTRALVDTVCNSFTWVVDSLAGGHDTVGTYAFSTTAQTHILNTVGCDSLITLDLTVKYGTVLPSVDVARCYSYEWYGTTYTQSGVYSYTTPNGLGCDTVRTLNLTIHDTAYNDLYVVRCDNYTWVRSDSTRRTFLHDTVASYLLDHSQNDQFRSHAGCDSVDRLFLTINNSTENRLVVSACESYLWSNRRYYRDTYDTILLRNANAVGCDSLRVLNLTIKHAVENPVYASSCGPYRWINNEYYMRDTVGPQIVCADTASNGCDSILVLYLTVHPIQDSIILDTNACDEFIWNGSTYSASGRYTQHLYTNDAARCDSVVTYNVRINTSNSGTFIDTACESYVWYVGSFDSVAQPLDTIFSESTNSYSTRVKNMAGCDSTVTLNLTIHTYTTGTHPTRACYSYTWLSGTPKQRVFNRDTIVTDTLTGINQYGCDSVVTLALTITGDPVGRLDTTVCDVFRYNNAVYERSLDSVSVRLGAGSSVLGCDSIVALFVTVNHSNEGYDTVRACDSLNWLGHHYTVTDDYVSQTSDSLYNIFGCDSIAHLRLIVNYSSGSIQNESVCDSFAWIDGTTYRASTDSVRYTYPNGNAVHCDSVVALHLTINNSASVRDTQVYCDSVIWAGVKYTRTIDIPKSLLTTAGCDSIVVTHYQINRSTRLTTPLRDSACDYYMWYGRQLDSTGLYWQVDTVRNIAGCDSSVSLYLSIYHDSPSMHDTVVACDSLVWEGQTYRTSIVDFRSNLRTVHGCDSSAYLHLTVNRSNNAVDTVSACDSLAWINGVVYYDNNSTAVYTLSNANRVGCDSTVRLNLTIYESSPATSIERTGCNTYEWYDSVYSTSGIHRHTLTNAAGCDSVMVLALTLIPSDTVEDQRTECDQFTWTNGQTYTASTAGVSNTLTNRFGCDSVVILQLTINNTTESEDSLSMCDSFIWHGMPFSASNNTAVDTMYGQNIYGCDSIVHLNLTMRYSTTATDSHDTCDAFTWINGVTYTASNYSDVTRFTNVAGCDSVVTLHLTLRYSSMYVDNHVAYRSYTWVDGQEYTQSTNLARYSVAGGNAAGCDSIMELHLTIISFPAPSINTIRDYMIVVNHYPEGAYVPYGYYRWYKDDNIVNEGMNDYYSENQTLRGRFYVEVPVDDSHTIWVRSNTVFLNVTGIDDVEQSTVSMKTMPNPVSSQSVLHVTVSLSDEEIQGATLSMYDLQGRRVVQMRPETQNINIPVTFAAGVYTIHLTTANGKQATGKVVVH
jgi:hypothetical protein